MKSIKEEKENFAKYTITKALFKSNNLSIYKGYNKYNNKNVIIKYESKSLTSEKTKSIVETEQKVLHKLREIKNIPKIIDMYSDCLYNYLVIDYLGKDLEYIFKLQKKSENKYSKFSPGFCAFFMTEILPILHDIHKFSIYHCDIKPSNFIFNHKENKIYLIDFSAAQTEANSNLSLVGTPKFCSYYCHESAPYSPRDDLISLGYVLLYFYLGYLPWQKDYSTNNNKNYTLKTIKTKKSNLLLFLKGENEKIPEEINIYMNYCLSLTVNDDIDYKMLYLLFVRMLNSFNYSKETLNSELQVPFKNNLLTS